MINPMFFNLKQQLVVNYYNLHTLSDIIEILAKKKFHEHMRNILAPSFKTMETLNVDVEDILNTKVNILSILMDHFAYFIIKENNHIEKIELNCKITLDDINLFLIHTELNSLEYIMNNYANKTVEIDYYHSNQKQYLDAQIFAMDLSTSKEESKQIKI
jgi:hypothetical protein